MMSMRPGVSRRGCRTRFHLAIEQHRDPCRRAALRDRNHLGRSDGLHAGMRASGIECSESAVERDPLRRARTRGITRDCSCKLPLFGKPIRRACCTFRALVGLCALTRGSPPYLPSCPRNPLEAQSRGRVMLISISLLPALYLTQGSLRRARTFLGKGEGTALSPSG